MHGLKELQAAFKRGVMQGDAGIIDVIADSQTASRELRLAVYEHAYRSRLVEALGTDCAMLRMVTPPLPMTSRILSGSILNDTMRGACSDIWVRGDAMARFISPRMCSRASLA